MADIRKDLRIKVGRLKHAGWPNGEFVPAGSLQQTLTAQDVDSVLRSCSFEPYDLKTLQQAILNGGHAIFAILLLIREPGLLLDFDKKESLVDSKLPFTEEQLKSINDDEEFIGGFLKNQWEFIAPVFGLDTGHRELDENRILPFRKESNGIFAEGAFGEVLKAEAYVSHMGGQPNSSKGTVPVAIKKMKATSTDEEFSRELEVLSYLNHLRHPNITTLLGSFTHSRVHYFIFPQASKDLGAFLAEDKPEDWFTTDGTWYLSLARLCSAIERMHNYTSDTLKINLIGCHHDIKPRNILVEKDKLLLADFGLSTLKPVGADSKSQFTAGSDDYRSPESQDILNDFAAGPVSRPADIWSLACIIMEILVYMRSGEDGVREFSLKRKFKSGENIMRRFHQADKVSPAVQHLVAELVNGADEHRAMLVKLAESMLKIEAGERPKAGEVTVSLREISFKFLHDDVTRAYGTIHPVQHAIEVELEKMRFHAWGYVTGLNRQEGSTVNVLAELLTPDSPFEDAVSKLLAIRHELGRIPITSDGAVIAPIVFQLRVLNDELASILPREAQKRANSHLEEQLLNLDRLNLDKLTLSSSQQEARIKAFAAIKNMVDSLDNAPTKEAKALELSPTKIEKALYRGARQFCFWDSPSGIKQQVLLEHSTSKTHQDSAIQEQLKRRMYNIAKMLHSKATQSTLRVLHCVGFYIRPDISGFDFVFAFPPGASGPVSLETRLSKEDSPRMPLEDRFRIAYSLAKSLFEFHQVQWLHKNITASNVLFFRDGPLDPYLVGFNHCRPDQPEAFSEGLDPRSNDYHHPQYARGNQRYRAEYDYYSLGMVLLELGLWTHMGSRIANMKGRGGTTAEQVLEELCTRYVPRLNPLMGSRYRIAVEHCLKGFGGGQMNSKEDSLEVKRKFKARVLAPLEELVSATAVRRD